MRRKKTAITQMLEALSDEERLKLFKFVIEVAWDIKRTEAKELWVKQSEQGEGHMIYYLKGNWTNKDVEDFEDGKESERFRVINNTVRVICRSKDDASGWHTHEAIEAKLKGKNT